MNLIREASFDIRIKIQRVIEPYTASQITSSYRVYGATVSEIQQ